MTDNRVTIIHAPEDTAALLDCDVAGRLVRIHLAERHAEIFGADVHVARQGVTAKPLKELVPPGAGVFIIDGRAWFPPGTTPGDWLARGAGTPTFRVVADAPFKLPYKRATLAVYLRGEDLTEAAGLASEPLPAACEQILAGLTSVAGRAPIVVSHGLLVDSYDAVARLEASVMQERATAAMSMGVRLRDPSRVYIRGSLVCGVNVCIDVDVIFEGDVVLGDHVQVDAHCIVSGSSIRSKTRVKPFSLVEGSQVGSSCTVGPYARIRPDSRIGDDCQIGNFVEVKSSTIGDGSRINHHSFIGDSVLEARVTIGAGTITCNHDGTKTNRTIIGRDAYIGSGCKLVAPLRIGDRATIAAGSTITEDVPAATLTLARSRQVTIANWRGPRSARGE
jgi:UDP-3-O-[3-hydroxymyristoyl] glucosamine N-acyltransferase